MRSGCVQSIIQYAQARGKNLNQGDLRKVEELLTKHFRQVGNDIRAGDQRLAAMTPFERLQEGAERAAREILQQKQKKAVNVAKQILATTRNEKFLQRVAPAAGNKQRGLMRTLVPFVGSGNMGFKDLDTRKTEIKNFYTSKMVPFFRATEKFPGFWEDKKSVQDFVREVKGKSTGNPVAKSAAKIWLDDAAEPLRKQSNDAGSDIAKRGDWGLPQNHDSLKVAAAGFDKWKNDTMPALDRTQFNDVNGRPLTDAEMGDFLKEAYKPLSTDGASEIKPGAYSSTSIKARGSQERQLHFTPEGWIDYHAKYGADTILGTVANHIDRMATNIAAMETFGPNAESGFKYLSEKAYKDDVEANPKKKSMADRERRRTQAYFDTATGKHGEMANPTIAHAFEEFRALSAAAKLAYAPVSALGDTTFLHLIAKTNNIPQADAWLSEMRVYNPLDAKERRVMEANGIGLETVLHSMNRFGQDSMGHGIISTMANQLFRVNLLNKMDAGRRRAVGAMMYKHAGDLVTDHADISTIDKKAERVFLAQGITDDQFAIWKKAQLDDRGMLTPAAVMDLPDSAIGGNRPDKARLNAAQALVGYAAKQAQYPVPMMTAKTAGDVRYALGPRVKGSVPNELLYSIMQFKSFALSIMQNTIAAIKDEPTVKGKVYYGAAFLAGTLATGALSYQLKAMLHGKNPQNMDPGTPEGRNFWVRAVMQGGSFGLWGDLAAGPVAENKWEDLAHMAGPLYDTANQIGKTAFLAGQAAFGQKGKGQEAGLAAVQLAKGLTPETIYTQEAFNHLVFQNLQEMIKPGYSQRVKQRAQKEQGTSYYWPPGQAVPDGPPNLNTAVGGR